MLEDRDEPIRLQTGKTMRPKVTCNTSLSQAACVWLAALAYALDKGAGGIADALGMDDQLMGETVSRPGGLELAQGG